MAESCMCDYCKLALTQREYDAFQAYRKKYIETLSLWGQYVKAVHEGDTEKASKIHEERSLRNAELGRMLTGIHDAIVSGRKNG